MLYRFDAYTLDTQLYGLRHAGILCPLEPQVFVILHYLLAHRDRVVTRQELQVHGQGAADRTDRRHVTCHATAATSGDARRTPARRHPREPASRSRYRPSMGSEVW